MKNTIYLSEAMPFYSDDKNLTHAIPVVRFLNSKWREDLLYVNENIIKNPVEFIKLRKSEGWRIAI
jgi:hypothetical protein